MTYLSKEATNKDHSLKMKYLLPLDDKSAAALNTESIWKSSDLFRDRKGEFIINKANFPENTLIYANQGSTSTLKGGDYAICLDYVILGQLIYAKNLPDDFDNYRCQPDEVKLCVHLYNVETGQFKGVQDCLVYIMVRGDKNEMIFSYGYDKDKSSVLYSTCKQILPNLF